MMRKTFHSQSYQKLSPPANLNPANVRIWSGWNELGNKEVAREASAKGFYVNLAIRFIATRKAIDFDEAEKWFQDEVLKWFKELLERKQVHRASHVLNNINLDATKELTNVFCETENKELREYIGDHLLKSRKLDPLLKNSWVLLNGIQADENLFLSLADKQYSANINGILNLDCDLKSNIAVVLFFKTYDLQLEPFLNAECLWSFLVVNDKIDIIKLWINVQYSENELDYDDRNFKADVLECLVKLFKKHNITDALINSISQDDEKVYLETQNIILNELSRFGVFNSVDSNNLVQLLQRLRKTGSVFKYKQVLQLRTSSISIQTFYDQLVTYCLNNDLESVVVSLFLLNDLEQDALLSLNEKCNLLLSLMNSVREATVSINDLKTLQANILSVCRYLNCDVFSYFKVHPIILVLLTLFDNDLNFIDVVHGVKDVILLDNLEINLNTMFESLPVLKAISDKFQNKIVVNFPTVWHLLSNHTSLNTTSVTEFVQSIGSVPHFNCNNIVHLYGYKKAIDTLYFLKQHQPSKACRMLLMDSTKSEELNKESIYLKAEKLALKNFTDANISAATVAFLEMLGESSKQLRIHLEAIKTIVSATVSSYIDENVRRFLQVKDNPKVIAGILENTIINSVTHLDAQKDLVEILRKHEIVIKFCTLHGLNLPERLLHLFAVNNLWLPFLICAQIYNYPLHQIRQSVQNFKNPHLLEHISHSVLHNIDIDAITGKRNPRQSLYSKLGVRQSQKKSAFSEEVLGTSASSLSSYDSMCSATSSSDSLDPTEGDIMDMKATLLQALLRCHNSADPPKALLQAAQLYRNPLLAVLATSYEPDSVVINWLVWLGVSCDIYDVALDYDTMSLCPQTVTHFLRKVVQQQYVKTLLESIEIFLPENPIRHFLMFLSECVRFKFDNDTLKENMVTFYKGIRCIRSNSIISETDYEITYLNNKVWIQKVALVLAVTVLEYNFASLIDQIYFVEALCAVDTSKILNIENRFENLLNILKSIRKLNSEVKLDFSKIYDPEEYKIMVNNYLNILIEKLEFDEALVIAAMEGVNKDNILIEQFKSLATKRVNETFWMDCSETFHNHSSVPETVIQFFQESSKEIENVSYEKYTILKLAYKWAVESSHSKLDEIEIQMWVSYIHLQENDKNRALEMIFRKLSYSEMKEKLESIKTINGHIEVDNFVKNMDSAISVLLNFGHYWEALKLAKMFAYKHADLEILMLCASVAEGLITLDKFNKEQRLLLNSASGFPCRSTSFRSSKMSSTNSDFNSGSLLCTDHEIDPLDHFSKGNLFTLQRLVEKLKSGYTLGQNIYMMYRISVNIEIPYAVLLENDDDEKLLKDALDDNCKNKLEVVHDFITVYKWSKVKVTDFICEELINTINDYIKSNEANLVMWDVNLDSEFHLILPMIQDNCSLLGMKLFAYSKALHMSQSLASGELYRISEIALIVELLIRAHDCFTADCNMEGIAIVLKKSQALIALLLQLQSWKLIVRLLTGIRRYTEMEYVFQILKENEQFEFLLNRGSKKDNSLKLALLDYLKKHCPDNRELYRIVALHFTLFSEVAHLWELEADGVIRNLITISKLEMENNGLDPATEPFVMFSGTDGTKICLHKAMENYSHASQYHLQGEKLSKATHSAKQAELIALQISRVKNLSTKGSTICLLQLDFMQIHELLTKHLSFPQALIMIEAYDYRPNWADILYQQCVVNGRLEYLQQFMDNFRLSDHLVHTISRKFLVSKQHSTAVSSMKEILMQVPSVHVKYKLASELGFSDIVQDILAEDKGAYLKDTVWKKGFKNLK